MPWDVLSQDSGGTTEPGRSEVKPLCLPSAIGRPGVNTIFDLKDIKDDGQNTQRA